MRSRLIVAALLALPLIAQVPTPAARLEAATDLTSLDAIQEKPWHLKLTVTTFDDRGLTPQNGTIDVWRSGTSEKTAIAFGANTRTRLTANGNTYTTHTGQEIPYRSIEMLEYVLRPGPVRGETAASQPEERKETLGKLKAECIMLSQPTKHTGITPLGLFPTYCIDPASGLIRITYEFGGRLVAYNGFGKFMGHNVVTAAEMSDGMTLAATAKLSDLRSFTPLPDEFTPTPEMEAETHAMIFAGVMAGAILKKVPPIYPESAKRDHTSGTVILHAIIDRTGHVRRLRPMGVFDSDLAIAAVAAVRQWTYTPYLLKGEPTEVDTTISVNFHLNAF